MFLRAARPRQIYACATCYYSCVAGPTIAARCIGYKHQVPSAPKPFSSKSAFQSHINGYHHLNKTSKRNFSKEYKIQSSYTPTDDVIESTAMNWIRKVVIGYNLCPFAEKPLREKKLHVSVVRGNDPQWVASTVLHEMIYHSEKPGTTVVVAPEYYPDDFEPYMSLVQYLQDEILEENDDIRGEVQIAPFHPLFQFEGSDSDGVDNYTNRSPYPMFHILREVEVAGAVQKLGGDASKVWERNVKLLENMEEKLGRDGVVKAMSGEAVEGMDELLKEIKIQE